MMKVIERIISIGIRFLIVGYFIFPLTMIYLNTHGEFDFTPLGKLDDFDNQFEVSAKIASWIIFFYLYVPTCLAILLWILRPLFNNQPDSFTELRRLSPSKLDFARSVAKRLDEHRELVLDLQEKTDYLSSVNESSWRSAHLATQDDYLMYLFYLRYGVWPDQPGAENVGFCRPRPSILGKCMHPLYQKMKVKSVGQF
jgi:hypothetical protein